MTMHTDGACGRSRAARCTLATLTAGALVVLPATGAQADDTCNPSDAWTQTVSAVGDPTMMVDNPDFVPEIPPRYLTVTHPAVTETQKVPDQRYSWNPKDKASTAASPAKTGSTPLTQPDEWTANTRNHNGTDPLDVAFGGADGAWFYWTSTSVEVVITEAWDQEVLVMPGTPAQGDRLIEVENPDYVPGRQIEHPAVVCTTGLPADTPTANTPTAGTPTTETPTTETPTTGPPTATASSTPAAVFLAKTGSDARTRAIVAAVLLLLGSALTVASHRRATNQH